MSMEYEEPTGIDCIDRNSIKYYSGHGGYMYASKGEIDKLPSVSSGVCEHDKQKVLDKIRAEIEDTGAYEQEVNGKTEFLKGITYCLNIIDKYKAEIERQERSDKR